MKDLKIIKKDGTLESFKLEKINNACDKAARRTVKIKLTDEDHQKICNEVIRIIEEQNVDKIEVYEMHNIVESVLREYYPEVGKSYSDYRNYKKDFIHMMDEVYQKSQTIRYIGDKDNANTDSALVATKRSLIFNELNKELYRKFFMTVEELQACKDGYLYVHDQSARLDTMNCFRRDTRFITKDGIKSFYDFNDGDETMVITHKGRWRKATVHKYGWQEIQEVTFTNESDEKTVFCTENHRWILIDNSETTKLSEGDVLCIVPESEEPIWTVSTIEKGKGTVEVWCLAVEEDHSFLLEGGIPTGNCCLFDVQAVLKGGFEMGNIFYTEPKSLDVAFDVIGDIILSTAAQQYGGFTVPEIDFVLEPYAEKSYIFYTEMARKFYEAILLFPWITVDTSKFTDDDLNDFIDEWATSKVERDFEQGFQGIEYKLNTVGSSRGDYPFITMTFGRATSRFGRMASKVFLRVHQNGQGKPGFKKPVLFPKLVFLYDKNLHGPGKELEDVFEAAVDCSSKTMYPDWLSLTGKGYVCDIYRKYGLVISPMGCRAFLSPWYERGGMEPADEDDRPVFVGRFNIGAVSLNLPMILQKSRKESRDFYEVLDYYLELIRGIHIRTYDYLGEMHASVNPVAYCEGGFYGGHLKPTDKIKPILKSATASFGITALNELQYLYNGKTITEDGNFALEVLKYINKKVDEYKHEDGNLYAIYGTPAESLCLTGDTIVETQKGFKPIKEVKAGEFIRSYNDLGGFSEFKEVVEAKKTREHAPVFDVKLATSEGTEVIQATMEHPFAVKNEDTGKIKYKTLNQLKHGDLLITDSYGTTARVDAVLDNNVSADTYNLEVEGNHNYFVGQPAVLVHNCGLQVKQFRKLYGIIEGVSSRQYVSNSFHCGVWEDINPIEKQDLEGRFWDYCKGGRIQYVRYPISYNRKAIVTLIRRAMELGYYEGVNLSLAYCDDCGHQELEMDVCPVCGSRNLTKIDRMNGYLSYSRVHGDTRLNAAKMAEIADRRSM